MKGLWIQNRKKVNPRVALCKTTHNLNSEVKKTVELENGIKKVVECGFFIPKFLAPGQFNN